MAEVKMATAGQNVAKQRKVVQPCLVVKAVCECVCCGPPCRRGVVGGKAGDGGERELGRERGRETKGVGGLSSLFFCLGLFDR